jgi:GDP-4-dehydro-6-deoxy-D-mannose reductase
VAAGDEVTGLGRHEAAQRDGVRWLRADLADAEAARRAVARAEPAHVFHLAAQSFVPASWEDPGATLRDNLTTTLNVLEAVRREAASARVVVASSGEVYGPPARLPVTEDAPLRPQNPYAVSKASADLLAGFYADAHRLHVIRARAFNHAGPGQAPGYAIASFARQLSAAQIAGERPARIVTGNPGARRDYTDVRDVVRAYRLLAERAAPGTYNVCSGRSTSAAELVTALGELAAEPVEHVVDRDLVRGHEVMDVRGDASRLTAATGWGPTIDLRRTLVDTVAWWRERLKYERLPVEAPSA